METLTAYFGRLCAIASLVFVGSCASFTYQQIDKYSGINHGTWKDGDIMLKGLFPLTFQDGGNCDRLDSTGTTWMMAMIYAVDKINNVSSLLPNKTIGYEIEDTCQSIPKTMSFALEIVSKYRPNSVCRSLEDCCRLDTNHFEHKRISAVIGPASSWISIPVARLLGLYGIPQISYASTSRILADKTRYGSFLRTVPSDQFQAQAMAELVHYFHWNYVFLIASDDDYGKMGAAAFKTAAKNLSVCIANDEFVSFGSPNADRQIEDTMLKLKSAERAEVVIVFSYLEQGEMLLKKAEQFEITDRTWVTSDGWSSVSSEIEKLNISKNTLKGLLSFSIRSKPVTDFENFLRSTSVQKAWNNSWFTKLLEETLKCQASQNNRDLKLDVSPPRKRCDPGATLPADHEIPTDFVANVIDAVYVVAHAVHNILTCNQTRCPNISLPISPETLFDFASKADFSGVDYTKVKFDKNGERTNSDYVIRNLHLSSKDRLQFIDVGHWNKYGDETRFTVNQSLIQWNKGKKPVSTCFRECQPGEKVVGQSECCWHCQKCDKGQVSFTSGSLNCTACNETHYANAKRTQCIFREIVYLKVSDPAGIAILTLSCLVLLVLTSVALIFVRERRTPVVMDSSPYLLILFFITLLLSSILTIIHVGCKPTDASCTSTSILLVLVFLFYSAFFLIKTKSATQFLKSAVSRLRDMHIAHLQLLGVGVLFLVQSILIIAWQATSISIARFQNQEDNTRLLECYESFSAAHIIAICYPIVVLVVATVLAYRERHLPDNFNEAKSMSFSTLALCILLVAFIPTYRYVYGTNRILVVAFTLFVSAFSCMGCMFVPKLYIIFLRPERNTAESKRETAEQYVTDPGPSFEQATTGSRVSQDLGHVNHGASDGLTNGRKWAVSLSSDNVADMDKRKEEKQEDSAIYQEELLNKGKEAKISNKDEVSYGASSSLLNDSSMYSTFFRTCSSNRHLAISLAAVIAYFRWSCINIVSSREEGSYLEIAQDLKQELKYYNICVAIDEVAGSYDEIPGIIFKIKRRATVTVSVLLGSDDYVAHILDEIRNKNLTKRIWIGINIPRIDNTFVIDGSLWISTPAEDLGELGSYIKKVSADISGAYFKGLAANRYRPENVTQSNFLYLQRFPWDKIVYVMNSVLAIASGLESVKTCRHGDPHCSNCLEENFTLSYVRNLLLRQLEGSSFVDNRDVYVSFNKNRELNTEFDILNLLITDNSTLTSFRVGKTTGHRGVIINASEIRWPGNEPEVPFSECWEHCPSGSYTENYSGVCWWSCHKCPHGTYNSNSTSTLCSACPKEQMTNGLQSACVDKPLIIIKAGEFLAVIFLSACGLGEMLTLLVLGVFVRYHVTPVVKAANLTLSLLSLIVLLAWFLIPGLYIGQPTNVTCNLRAVVLAVLYTAITSVLLTKTNRVIKIFSAINVKKHRFLSNYWYGFLTCALIIVQLGICALHLLIFPPKLVYDYSVSDALLVQCKANLGFDVTALGYNIFLSLTCCVLAYQSRKLPSAYTEFKWIFLAMFTNISSWLIILINSHAWPSTKGNLICTIMALMVGAYAMLFLLFLPKVRVIFFRPEKNTKQAAIESTRRYSLEQASGIDLSPVQGSDQRRNSSPACLAMQFMKGSIGKLPAIKNNLGSRRSQSSKITTINECSEERKTSI